MRDELMLGARLETKNDSPTRRTLFQNSKNCQDQVHTFTSTSTTLTTRVHTFYQSRGTSFLWSLTVHARHSSLHLAVQWKWIKTLTRVALRSPHMIIRQQPQLFCLSQVGWNRVQRDIKVLPLNYPYDNSLNRSKVVKSSVKAKKMLYSHLVSHVWLRIIQVSTV